MKHQESPDVDPAYGGDHEVRDHSGSVDPEYGGEKSLHVHHHDGPGVDPAYGGDESPGYLQRVDDTQHEGHEEVDPTRDEHHGHDRDDHDGGATRA